MEPLSRKTGPKTHKAQANKKSQHVEIQLNKPKQTFVQQMNNKQYSQISPKKSPPPPRLQQEIADKCSNQILGQKGAIQISLPQSGTNQQYDKLLRQIQKSLDVSAAARLNSSRVSQTGFKTNQNQKISGNKNSARLNGFQTSSHLVGSFKEQSRQNDQSGNNAVKTKDKTPQLNDSAFSTKKSTKPIYQHLNMKNLSQGVNTPVNQIAAKLVAQSSLQIGQQTDRERKVGTGSSRIEIERNRSRLRQRPTKEPVTVVNKNEGLAVQGSHQSAIQKSGFGPKQRIQRAQSRLRQNKLNERKISANEDSNEVLQKLPGAHRGSTVICRQETSRTRGTQGITQGSTSFSQNLIDGVLTKSQTPIEKVARVIPQSQFGTSDQGSKFKARAHSNLKKEYLVKSMAPKIIPNTVYGSKTRQQNAQSNVVQIQENVQASLEDVGSKDLACIGLSYNNNTHQTQESPFRQSEAQSGKVSGIKVEESSQINLKYPFNQRYTANSLQNSVSSKPFISQNNQHLYEGKKVTKVIPQAKTTINSSFQYSTNSKSFNQLAKNNRNQESFVQEQKNNLLINQETSNQSSQAIGISLRKQKLSQKLPNVIAESTRGILQRKQIPLDPQYQKQNAVTNKNGDFSRLKKHKKQYSLNLGISNNETPSNNANGAQSKIQKKQNQLTLAKLAFRDMKKRKDQDQISHSRGTIQNLKTEAVGSGRMTSEQIMQISLQSQIGADIMIIAPAPLTELSNIDNKLPQNLPHSQTGNKNINSSLDNSGQDVSSSSADVQQVVASNNIQFSKKQFNSYQNTYYGQQVQNRGNQKKRIFRLGFHPESQSQEALSTNRSHEMSDMGSLTNSSIVKWSHRNRVVDQRQQQKQQLQVSGLSPAFQNTTRNQGFQSEMGQQVVSMNNQDLMAGPSDYLVSNELNSQTLRNGRAQQNNTVQGNSFDQKKYTTQLPSIAGNTKGRQQQKSGSQTARESSRDSQEPVQINQFAPNSKPSYHMPSKRNSKVFRGENMQNSIDKSEDNITVCGKNIAFWKQKGIENGDQISQSMQRIKAANTKSSMNRNQFNKSIGANDYLEKDGEESFHQNTDQTRCAIHSQSQNQTQSQQYLLTNRAIDQQIPLSNPNSIYMVNDKRQEKLLDEQRQAILALQTTDIHNQAPKLQNRLRGENSKNKGQQNSLDNIAYKSLDRVKIEGVASSLKNSTQRSRSRQKSLRKLESKWTTSQQQNQAIYSNQIVSQQQPIVSSYTDLQPACTGYQAPVLNNSSITNISAQISAHQDQQQDLNVSTLHHSQILLQDKTQDITEEYADNSPNESLELQPEIVQVKPLKGTKPEKGESRGMIQQEDIVSNSRQSRNIKQQNRSLQKLKLEQENTYSNHHGETVLNGSARGIKGVLISPLSGRPLKRLQNRDQINRSHQQVRSNSLTSSKLTGQSKFAKQVSVESSETSDQKTENSKDSLRENAVSERKPLILHQRSLSQKKMEGRRVSNDELRSYLARHRSQRNNRNIDFGTIPQHPYLDQKYQQDQQDQSIADHKNAQGFQIIMNGSNSIQNLHSCSSFDLLAQHNDTLKSAGVNQKSKSPVKRQSKQKQLQRKQAEKIKKLEQNRSQLLVQSKSILERNSQNNQSRISLLSSELRQEVFMNESFGAQPSFTNGDDEIEEDKEKNDVNDSINTKKLEEKQDLTGHQTQIKDTQSSFDQYSDFKKEGSLEQEIVKEGHHEKSILRLSFGAEDEQKNLQVLEEKAYVCVNDINMKGISAKEKLKSKTNNLTPLTTIQQPEDQFDQADIVQDAPPPLQLMTDTGSPVFPSKGNSSFRFTPQAISAKDKKQDVQTPGRFDQSFNSRQKQQSNDQKKVKGFSTKDQEKKKKEQEKQPLQLNMGEIAQELGVQSVLYQRQSLVLKPDFKLPAPYEHNLLAFANFGPQLCEQNSFVQQVYNFVELQGQDFQIRSELPTLEFFNL